MTQEVQAAARGYRGAARLYAGQKGHRAWGTSRPLPRVRRRHVFIFAHWVKWYEICVQTTAFFLFHKKPFFFFLFLSHHFFFLLRKHMLCPDGLEMNVLLPPGPSHFLSRFLSRSSQPPDEAAQRGRAGEGLPATWPPVLACDQLLWRRRGESGLTVSSGPPGSRGAVTSPPVLPSPTWKLFGRLHPTLYVGIDCATYYSVNIFL